MAYSILAAFRRCWIFLSWDIQPTKCCYEGPNHFLSISQ